MHSMAATYALGARVVENSEGFSRSKNQILGIRITGVFDGEFDGKISA